jgi:hypothetical protein
VEYFTLAIFKTCHLEFLPRVQQKINIKQ